MMLNEELEINLINRDGSLTGFIVVTIDRMPEALPELEKELEGEEFDEIEIDVRLKSEGDGSESWVRFDNLEVLKTFLSV